MRKRIITSIIAVLIILAICFITQNNIGSETSAIGIIGGADGPTAIFVASKANPQIISRYIMLACTVISLVVLIKRRRR